MGLTLWGRLAILYDLFLICLETLIPILHAILAEPTLLLHPKKLKTILFSNVWSFMASSVDERCRELKQSFIRPNAFGCVLDVGAGHGHTLKYLDKKKVTRYIALEPNGMFHDKIREAAHEAGFSQSDVDILGYGVEQTDEIVRLLGYHRVDTIVSVLTLCGVPGDKGTIERLCTDVLNPRGGQLLFYEHVLCDDKDVAFWQRFWSPFWQAIVGCRLDRPTHIWIDELDVWTTRELSGKPNQPFGLFWHQVGRYVR